MRVAQLTSISCSFLSCPSVAGDPEREVATPKPRAAFSGVSQGVERSLSAGPQDSGGAETRRARERKQKPAVLQGAATDVRISGMLKSNASWHSHRDRLNSNSSAPEAIRLLLWRQNDERSR